MFSALTNLLKSKSTVDLLKTLVLQNDEGDYLMFGTYIIRKVDDLYQISVGSTVLDTFSTLKTAVTWITMNHRNMINEANDVNLLDKNISSTEFSIELHKRMYKRTKDSEMKIIYLNKLQQSMLKKRKLTSELDEHIRKIQTWQLNKFKQQTTK